MFLGLNLVLERAITYLNRPSITWLCWSNSQSTKKLILMASLFIEWPLKENLLLKDEPKARLNGSRRALHSIDWNVLSCTIFSSSFISDIVASEQIKSFAFFQQNLLASSSFFRIMSFFDLIWSYLAFFAPGSAARYFLKSTFTSRDALPIGTWLRELFD